MRAFFLLFYARFCESQNIEGSGETEVILDNQNATECDDLKADENIDIFNCTKSTKARDIHSN